MICLHLTTFFRAATVENTVDTNIKSLPRTGDISAPAPLASVSMDLGVALLMVLKKRKKKDQERFAD